MEILEDGNRWKSGEGESIVTNMKRRLMPVIRFRTGDLGRWIEGPCPCGSTDPLFELLGRVDDLLVIGGMNLGPGDFERSIAMVGGLSGNFQLHALSDGASEALVLRVEALDARLDRRRTARELYSLVLANIHKLAEALRLGWLKRFMIEIRAPGKLLRNRRTGKIRAIIDDRRPS